MKRIVQILLLITCLSSCYAIAEENREISYLLTFIAGSECRFIRNGKEYPAKEASEHLEYKYNHVRSRIKTAEIFIDKIASKSSISRQPYAVRCGEQYMKTEQWLTEALLSFRKTAEE